MAEIFRIEQPEGEDEEGKEEYDILDGEDAFVDLEEADVDPLVYDEDEPNLVPIFMEHEEGIAALREIADKVHDDWQTAWDSNADYRKRVQSDWSFFVGDLPPKEFPFENAANTHVPISLETVSRLVFRVHAELFGDWQNIFGVVPTGPDDENQADILYIHGNWQLREGIPDFRRQMNRALLCFFVIGDVTCHSYYDREREQNVHEVLTPDDFVVPYMHTSTAPDYADAPYVVKILRRYQHQIEAMEHVWYDVDKVIDGEPPSWSDEPEDELATSISESTGVMEPDDDSAAPYKILHYEGWLDLPNQEKQRYCQVLLHEASKAILSLTIHEEPEWRDKLRYDRQVQELDQYRQAEKEFGAAQMEYQVMSLQAELAGLSDMLAMPPPMPPEPPDWLDDPEDPFAHPELPKRVPIHMFSHGVCIENLHGNAGIALGRIEADLNRAANTAIQQFTDAATLANCWGLIISSEIEFESPFQFEPGFVNKAQGVSGSALREAIMEMKPQAANPQLMQIVESMYAWGQSAIQSPGVLSGEPGKSGETYRGLSARLEQATKQISVAARNFAEFLRHVLKNNARLNAAFLPDEEMIQLVDWRIGMLRDIQVGRHLYDRDYNIQFHSDLRFATEEQRAKEAMELIQLPQQVPPLGQNLAFWYAAVKKLLEARRAYEMIPLLGPEPPVPVTPFGLPPPMPTAPPAGAGPGGGSQPPGSVPPGAQQAPPSGAPPPPQPPG